MSNFMENSNNLLIVDALNLSFRWKHSDFKFPEVMANVLNEQFEDGKISEEELRAEVREYFKEQGAYFGEKYKDTVESFAASYGAPRIIITADSGKSAFRKAIYPEYKANRTAKVDLNTVVDDAVFACFFDMYQDALSAEIAEVGTVIRFAGVEADDIAAYIINHTDVTTRYDNVWLVTSDSDWDLLLRDNVHRFNWATQKNWKNITKTGPRPREVTLDNWGEHHEYNPEQHLFAKCLEGDSGDNVPGVDGIGPKRALEIINKYGDIDNLIENLPLKGTAQYIKNLNAFKDIFPMTRKLMDLNAYCHEAVLEHGQAIQAIINE